MKHVVQPNSPDDDQDLDARLELGSEPFWMQDVRLATRRIEARRLAARSDDEHQAASNG